MIIFVLITITLQSQFAQEHPQWTSAQHWLVGIGTSLLFFASVLFHELAHSAVARAYKIPVVSITLFVFGGVARIGREQSILGRLRVLPPRIGNGRRAPHAAELVYFER